MAKLTDKMEIVLTDLDSLFDTRLSTILDIGGEELLTKVIEEGYDGTEVEWFDCLDMDEYHKRYDARDEDTLGSACLSSAIHLLNHHFVEVYKHNNKEQIEKVSAGLYVNVYPYDPEHPNVQAALSIISKKLLIKGISITAIESRPVDITPNVVTQHNICYMYIYDYITYISDMIRTDKIHNPSEPFSGMVLRPPRIIRGDMDHEEVKKSVLKTGKDNPFSDLAALLFNCITIEYQAPQTYRNDLLELTRVVE